MPSTDETPVFDLGKELARIDRQRAELNREMDRPSTFSEHFWLWALAAILPITVGVVLGLAL